MRFSRVLACFAAFTYQRSWRRSGSVSARLGLLAVFVLALQFFTGLYLFVLPYAAKWRSGSQNDVTGGLPRDERPV